MIAPGAFGEDSAKAKETAAPAPSSSAQSKEDGDKVALDTRAENLHAALTDPTIKKKWEDAVSKLDSMEKQWTLQGRHVVPVVDMKQDASTEQKTDKKKVESDREARKIAEEEDKQKQKAREQVEALKRDTQKSAKE